MTLGRHSDQGSLFGPDPFLTRRVRQDSFYGFLASLRGQLFGGRNIGFKENPAHPVEPIGVAPIEEKGETIPFELQALFSRVPPG